MHNTIEGTAFGYVMSLFAPSRKLKQIPSSSIMSCYAAFRHVCEP